MFKKFFSKKTSDVEQFSGLSVKFHIEANFFGEHGMIVVTHKQKGIIERPVRFVFPGISTPPKMDLTLMQYLWKEAFEAGYIPHHVLWYGVDNDMVIEPEQPAADEHTQLHVVGGRASGGFHG